MLTVLLYAGWLSVAAGQQTPEFVASNGLTLTAGDMRQVTQIDDVQLNHLFFYLVPEFHLLADHQNFLATHHAVWQTLEQKQTHQITMASAQHQVSKRMPTLATVLVKNGAMFTVAGIFAIGALIALFRHQGAPGRAAVLFLFGASLYSLTVATLVTRGLTLPFPMLEQTLALYLIGTCCFAGLIYFPFVFCSEDLKPWVAGAVFWVLAFHGAYTLVNYFLGRAAIAGQAWFSFLCVLLFMGRVVQQGLAQLRERNVTHFVLCYSAIAAPTFTFIALLSWPALLAVELSSLQYFVLTSTVIPIATISLLESELLQQRNRQQALQLAAQAEVSEQQAHQARQTVVMNLHDHVARSLDSISALALRAKLSGGTESPLNHIRDLATGAHRALRGLFSVSDEDCDTWPDLRANLREYGNSLVEHDAVDFQLNDSGLDVGGADDSAILLNPSVKLICFHVLSEAITNAIKHGQASTISAMLGANQQGFYLEVTDNGAGFNPLQVDESKHHGLTIMHKRATLIEGRISVRSSPGEGTTIQLNGPLSPTTTEARSNINATSRFPNDNIDPKHDANQQATPHVQ